MFDEDINDMDFSGGIRANRTFMEATPAPNPIFPNIFMTFIEMLKVSPSGVDMTDLRMRVHTADKQPVPKQTFSRWVKQMTGAGPSLLNYNPSKALIRLEESDNDPRAKKMVLTEEGLALARRMSRHDLERSYLDIQLEGYKEHIDWLNTDEMQHAKSLFETGHTLSEVETLMAQWRKDNPTKTREWQNTVRLEVPLPKVVDSDWLKDLHSCYKIDDEDPEKDGGGDAAARKMIKDAGIQPDDMLIRMLAMADEVVDGKAIVKISKSSYRNKGPLSAIIAKFVAKAKMMEVLKRHDWDTSELNIERIFDQALNIEEYVLKPSKTGPNDIDVVNTTTGEVEGGIEFKANAVDPATGTGHFATIIATLTKQIEDMKKASDEREQKLMDRIDKLTDALMEKK